MLPTLLLLLCAVEVPKQAADKDELKKLQGQWLVSVHEHGGKKVAAKDLAKLVLEVSGSKMTTRDAGDIKEDSTIVVLDAKAKPAALDLKITTGVDADKVVKAIYKVNGDSLTICVAEPGKDRPKAFAGKEGTGHTLLMFTKAGKK